MNALETQDLFCPYCGEPIEVLVDCTQGDQEYIEDCPVCCRPMVLAVHMGQAGPEVRARREDD